jgi:hypothetical protein
MGQISVEITGPSGSLLSGNQQACLGRNFSKTLAGDEIDILGGNCPRRLLGSFVSRRSHFDTRNRCFSACLIVPDKSVFGTNLSRYAFSKEMSSKDRLISITSRLSSHRRARCQRAMRVVNLTFSETATYLEKIMTQHKLQDNLLRFCPALRRAKQLANHVTGQGQGSKDAMAH